MQGWASALLGIVLVVVGARQSLGHIGDDSARFRDQNDMGCHMSPGAPGAPASGAEQAGGNEAHCVTCQSASGLCRWWVNEPWVNMHFADQPLSYLTSSGQPMAFRFLYKQRFKLPAADECATLWALGGTSGGSHEGNDQYITHLRTQSHD